MKRKNDGEQMKEWVQKLHEAELENLPDKESLQQTHKLSDTFYAKMERLLKKHEQKEAWTKFKRYSAAVAAAVAAVCLMLNPQVGAKVRDVIVQWQDKLAFFVLGTPNDESVQIPEYVLTYVPEGFELVDKYYSGPDFGGGALYYNDTRGLDFGYFPSDSSNGVNNEYVIWHEITLSDNVTKAIYLESTNPDYASTLLWKSEDGNIGFCITGELDYEELMKVYEGVQIKK